MLITPGSQRVKKVTVNLGFYSALKVNALFEECSAKNVICVFFLGTQEASRNGCRVREETKIGAEEEREGSENRTG